MEGLHDRPVGRFAHAEGRRDRAVEERWIKQRGKIDEPRAVRIAVGNRPRELEGESRLAAAARAGQGEDSALRDRRPERLDLGLPSDEGGYLAGQVRWRLDRSQRPRIVRHSRKDQPMKAGRVLEVLHGSKALVDQVDAAQVLDLGKARHEEGGERVGDDDLAAVPDGRDPGGVVHVDPDVVLGLAGRAALAQAALAEMQAHSDAKRDRGPPGLASESPLTGDRGRGGVGRTVEGGEERVALGLDHHAAVRLDHRPEQRVVARDDLRPGGRSDGALEPGRALDVGEQERDGRPGWQSHGNDPSSQSRRVAVHLASLVTAVGAGERVEVVWRDGGRYWASVSRRTGI